jgi:hypothetical protein
VPEALREAVETFGAGMSRNARRTLTEEIVQASTFCAGASQLWQRRVRFSPVERLGSDSYLEIGPARPGEPTLYGLLQLKQLPDESRSTIGLQVSGTG